MITVDEVEFKKILRALIESAGEFTTADYNAGFCAACVEAVRALQIATAKN